VIRFLRSEHTSAFRKGRNATAQTAQATWRVIALWQRLYLTPSKLATLTLPREVNQSYRSAITGSTFMARLAGI